MSRNDCFSLLVGLFINHSARFVGNLPEALREIERALALEGSSRPQQGTHYVW